MSGNTGSVHACMGEGQKSEVKCELPGAFIFARCTLGYNPQTGGVMADINHEIKISAAPQAVYQALTSAAELTKWHTSRTENTNGKDDTFTTYPEDGPA